METKPKVLRLASSGTPDAINFPPRLISPPNQGGVIKAEGDPVAAADRDRKMLGLPEYTWQTCSRQARMVLDHMRRCTPRGAKPPWRSSPSVTPIQRMLDEGVPMEDLMELVEGAAMLIASGRQSAKWYYPGNLFGPKTLERWLADVAEHQAEREAADQRQRELDAIEQRSRDEAQAARSGPAPAVTDLRLRAIAAELLGAVRDKQEAVVASEHEEAAVGRDGAPAARAAGQTGA